MPDRPRPRLSLGLNGLSARQLAIRTWKRMEGHDAMIWAAAIAFYALFATVPSLALFLVVTILQLPDLSGTGGRTSGLGDLTDDESSDRDRLPGLPRQASMTDAPCSRGIDRPTPISGIRGQAPGEQEYLHHGATREHMNDGSGRRLDFRGRFAHRHAGDPLDLLPQ